MSEFDVQLPSRGILYRNRLRLSEDEDDADDTSESLLPDGHLKCRTMTTEEEAILAGTGSSEEKIRSVINRCVIDPRIKPDDLLLTDRMFVFINLRVRSFGADYRVRHRCAECNTPFDAQINLGADLEERVLRDDAREPFEVHLPNSGLTIGFRLLRGRDEADILRYVKRRANPSVKRGGVTGQRRTSQPTDDLGLQADPAYQYRLAKMIVTIDGEAVTTEDALDVVRGLDIADSHEFRLAIEDEEPGIDPTVVLDCPSCQYQNITALPASPDFFRPRTNRSARSV